MVALERRTATAFLALPAVALENFQPERPPALSTVDPPPCKFSRHFGPVSFVRLDFMAIYSTETGCRTGNIQMEKPRLSARPILQGIPEGGYVSYGIQSKNVNVPRRNWKAGIGFE